MKLEVHNSVLDGEPSFSFYCLGCKCSHGIWTKDNPNHTGSKWEFNGDLNKPTFSPSIKVTFPYKDTINICHSFIKNGFIEYLSDCTHELAGKTIELPEID